MGNIAPDGARGSGCLRGDYNNVRLRQFKQPTGHLRRRSRWAASRIGCAYGPQRPLLHGSPGVTRLRVPCLRPNEPAPRGLEAGGTGITGAHRAGWARHRQPGRAPCSPGWAPSLSAPQRCAPDSLDAEDSPAGVSTAGSLRQRDAAIAAGGEPQVAVCVPPAGQTSESSRTVGCGAETPTPGVVDRWLTTDRACAGRRSGGRSQPAIATLTVSGRDTHLPPCANLLNHLLYFARAGRFSCNSAVDGRNTAAATAARSARRSGRARRPRSGARSVWLSWNALDVEEAAQGQDCDGRPEASGRCRLTTTPRRRRRRYGARSSSVES